MQQTATEKALVVLECLETTRGRRSLAEIATVTGLPKATVHRILATLEKRGYVRQLPSREYALGPKIVALGVYAGGRDPLITVARPVLDDLVATCGEVVQLGVLQGTEMLYIERREPENSAVRLAAQPAPLAALHASAGGKVLLAHGDDDLFEQVIARGLHRFTSATIVDPDDLKLELARIRDSGFAVGRQERHEGVCGVAVPVRNRSGGVVATITAAGPLQRMTEEKIEELRRQLLVAAATIGGARD